MTAMQAWGWALVHSLWQGGLAAVGLASLLAIVPARAARTRYALAVATLVLMLALPIGTALLHAPPPAPGMAGGGSTQSAGVAAPAATGVPRVSGAVADETTLATRVRAAVEPRLPMVVVLWLSGVLVLSLRLVSGWRTVRRLETVGTRPAPRACVERLACLAARLRVTRPVRVFESAVVQVPAVIGWLRPVVLLPASALTGLTPLQLDALLAHELAHVRRCDYVVNLVQTVIETLLFYHPAVSWVSQRVREERERCCDDLAVAVYGDAHLYATALLGMERLRAATPALALTAGGGRASLQGRIRRLVAPVRAEIIPRWVAAVVAVAVPVAIGGRMVLTRGSDAPHEPAGRTAPGRVTDSGRTTPDTVVRHPDPARPLVERWEWARAQARRFGGRGVWIGYYVRSSLLVDFRGLALPGVRLGELVGSGERSDDLALLFRFADGRWPVLARVHAGSFLAPADLGGGALIWLGAAEDAASLARLQALFAAAPTVGLKEDLVAAVGLHGSTAAVVPILARWLAGVEPSSVRAQAAEWLDHHAPRARSEPRGDVNPNAAPPTSRSDRGRRAAPTPRHAARIRQNSGAASRCRPATTTPRCNTARASRPRCVASLRPVCRSGTSLPFPDAPPRPARA